jgi:hypothetical protein
MASTLAHCATARERVPLPAGEEERFAGWGVMALPFTSGHVLAFRRWSASSIGPGYSSVWHRDPAGRWQMWQTVQPSQACPRYFSAAIDRSHLVDDIDTEWADPAHLTIRVPGSVEWTLDARSTAATRLLNAAMSILPTAAWRAPMILRAMAPVAGALLRVGQVALVGRTPNGQRFRTGPNRLWVVRHATATVDGHDLGPIGPLPKQARLGDFWIPQRGIVAMGRAWFDLPASR